MATTFVEYTGDDNATKAFSFPSYQEADIKVTVDGTAKTNGNHFNITSYTTTGGGNVVFTSGNIPSSPELIRIFRDTDVDSAKATFTAGASVKAADLNNNITQLLYAAQEEQNQLEQTADIRDDAVTTSKIRNNAVTTLKIADDNVTMAKLGSGALPTDITVASANLVDGTIVNADVNASAAIAGTKISPDFGSQNIATTGTVDGRDVSVDGTKLDTIETGATADQTNAEIRAAVEAATDSNVFTDADHTKLNGIEAGATADQTNAEIKTAYEANANTNEFSDAEQSKLAGIETAATADQTASEIKTLLQSDKLELSEIDTTSLDSRYYTETEAEAKFLRQDSSETIASGVSWSNSDAFVATTAAINARIIDLIDEVGGFTAIANETSFPTTNPQGATGQAAILSIQAASTTLTPSGTTITIANGAGSGNTVTITGAPTIPSGFGFLVESTSTTHTYSFHRLVPIATQVNTVAQNITNIVAAGANVVDINNFADIYIISGSEPSQRNDGSSLQEGDLWFDSSNDNLQVYTGSAFSIITPSQSVLDDVAIVSGAITYSEDLGLITDAVSTGSSNGSLDIVADALEDEITFTVTAATGKFIIDGVDKPALTLYKGWTYTFDVSDASNAAHPLRFSSGGSAYNTGVTITGTQGQAGAKVQLVVPESQPTSFIYYCTNHSGMGNSITVKDDPIKTVSDNITSVNTTANSINNVNTTAGSISNINTVGASISDVNRYANEYQISASAPSSPDAGDLWFDTSANTLKNYNGSAWLGITSNSGIQNVADDTSPQLAATLDCQNNNLSNVGTIDGANLQLDFGTL
jgi:enamine deaminase RidA (YjgF/YER057c/UK114 family)